MDFSKPRLPPDLTIREGHLVIRWKHQNKPELKTEGDSICTMELELSGLAVKLSVTHVTEREPTQVIKAAPTVGRISSPT